MIDDYDVEKEKEILMDQESLGDSFVGFYKRCHNCHELTDNPDAEYCWNCGKKY